MLVLTNQQNVIRLTIKLRNILVAQLVSNYVIMYS